MTPIEIRRCIRKWELLRLPFNAVCVAGAWIAWQVVNEVTVGIDELPPASMGDPGVTRDFITGFAILNIAYCLIYAFEFVMSAFEPLAKKRAPKITVYLIGCVLGFLIASYGSSGIGRSVASAKLQERARQSRVEEMQPRGTTSCR